MNVTLSSILYDNKQIGWKRGSSYTAQLNAPAYKLFHTGPISTTDWRREPVWKKPEISATAKPVKREKTHKRAASSFDPNLGGTFNGLSTQPLKNLKESMPIDREAP